MKMKNSLLKKTTAGLFTAATVLTMAAASTTVLATTVQTEDEKNTLTSEFKITKNVEFLEGVTLPWGSNKEDEELYFTFNFTNLKTTAYGLTDKNMPSIDALKISGFSTANDRYKDGSTTSTGSTGQKHSTTDYKEATDVNDKKMSLVSNQKIFLPKPYTNKLVSMSTW